MIAASWPRESPLEERLLHVDPRASTITTRTIKEFPSLLSPGDVVVLNDAATIPASFQVTDGSVELRLVMRLGRDRSFRAVLFGPGDFRTPTEARPEPPRLRVGARLDFGDGFAATVVRVDAASPRLIDVEFNFEGAKLWAAIYRHGRPVQYAYVRSPLPLWHVQSRFASRPWALEMPSAGRPLTWGTLTSLRHQGVEIVSVTHAAGLSSTGSALLDSRLPMPERYEMTEAAVKAIRRAKTHGTRVVAVGTTVVRALEAAALEHGGALEAGVGEATLVVGPGFRPRIVDAVLSGMHAPLTSHFALLSAFATPFLLECAMDQAEAEGYLEHEFGDSCLVMTANDSVPARASPR